MRRKDVAIIVPVIRRPLAAERFMGSLGDNAEDADVYAVAQPEDTETIRAWLKQGATVLHCRDHRYGPKVNLGYRSTKEPWLLFVGDDVVFHPKALDRALVFADKEQKDLVSTNDGSSNTDRLERLAPHPLISRAYIDRLGACWDGPGTVVHEGYQHSCVDLEWSLKARQLRRYGYCEEAMIEHLHPVFDKSTRDEIYELGDLNIADDRGMFINRVMTFAAGGS